MVCLRPHNYKVADLARVGEPESSDTPNTGICSVTFPQCYPTETLHTFSHNFTINYQSIEAGEAGCDV